MQSEPLMPLPVALRALRYRNFRLFIGGQLISLVGTWMQIVAQSWLVYRLTGSAALLGAVGFFGQIPVFLLSPLGGVVADRHSRHRVIMATQAVSMVLALVLAGLTLGGVVRIWHVFVLSALLGVVSAFDIPARQAFLVDMAGKPDLINAIALNSSIFNGARIVGPALAGMLVASIGEGWCFFANGVSYAAVLGSLLLMVVAEAPPASPPGSPLERIAEGFRFVLQNPPVRALMVLLGVLSLTGMPYAVLMPIFADRVLGGGAEELGLLMGASGVGALGGALLLATRRSVNGLGRWVAVSAGAFGISLVLFAASRSLWLSMALLLPAGFFLMIEMGASNTLVQTMAPDELRGRVMSVYSMMFMGMAPIGALVAGAAAERFGAPLTVAAGGVMGAVAAGLFWMRLPALRAGARRLIVAQQLPGGDPPQEITTAGIPVDG
jgi:MFS family permease